MVGLIRGFYSPARVAIVATVVFSVLVVLFSWVARMGQLDYIRESGGPLYQRSALPAVPLWQYGYVTFLGFLLILNEETETPQKRWFSTFTLFVLPAAPWLLSSTGGWRSIVPFLMLVSLFLGVLIDSIIGYRKS